MNRQRLVVLAATILPVLCLLLWHPWSATMDDLGVYYAGARGLVNGEDIYQAHVKYYPEMGLGFTYPPFATMVFAPFAIGLPFARTLITVASALALLVIGWVITKKLRWQPAVVVAAFTGLAVSPVSWMNHWVWAIPAAALAWQHRGRLFSLSTGLSTVWIAVFLFALPRWLPFGGDREFDYSAGQTIAADSYLLCALTLIGYGFRLASQPLPHRVGAGR
jgi:hypothetical protein